MDNVLTALPFYPRRVFARMLFIMRGALAGSSSVFWAGFLAFAVAPQLVTLQLGSNPPQPTSDIESIKFTPQFAALGRVHLSVSAADV